MKELSFSDNLIRLRQERKITQKQLASFIGVTKGSVSKWENRQSMPDIFILPRLAAYFDVSIDELLGYEPQLNKEQIKKIYLDLVAEFGTQPFEETMQKSQALVKKYYACYPFLFQMCCLWLNHFMLANSKKRQEEILSSITDLCNHIISNCDDINICNNTTIIKAMSCLQLNQAQEVINTLKELMNPLHLSSQSDTVLIQAYQLTGQTNEADSFTQISMYSHLLSLVRSATQYLTIHCGTLSLCETTVKRIDCIVDAYHLDALHPNIAALFYYQTALVYCMHDKKEEALERLLRYVDCIEAIMKEPFLHGDSYFYAIGSWFEQLDIGGSAPRDTRFMIENAIQSLSHPTLSPIKDTDTFQHIEKSLEACLNYLR